MIGRTGRLATLNVEQDKHRAHGMSWQNHGMGAQAATILMKLKHAWALPAALTVEFQHGDHGHNVPSRVETEGGAADLEWSRCTQNTKALNVPNWCRMCPAQRWSAHRIVKRAVGGDGLNVLKSAVVVHNSELVL